MKRASVESLMPWTSGFIRYNGLPLNRNSNLSNPFFSCRNSPEAHFVAQRSFYHISGGLMEFSCNFLWSYKMFLLKFLWRGENRLKYGNCWRTLRVGYVWIPAQIIWSQMNLMRYLRSNLWIMKVLDIIEIYFETLDEAHEILGSLLGKITIQKTFF